MFRIGYFGDGPWSHDAFRKIIADDRFSIVFVCVRYDSEDRELIRLAHENSIPCLKHKNVNSSDFIEKVKGYDCHIFVSMSFNQIFKGEIMNLTPFSIINCHAGKLPLYRGRNVLNWALINDEKEFGITVHYVDEGIDTGDIILQQTYPISDDDHYGTLLKKAYLECPIILHEALSMIYDGVASRIKQSELSSFGMYCCRRKDGDEVLNWNSSSREIFNFVRAICHPGPIATAIFKGCTVKINKVEYIERAPTYKGIAGTILQKEKNGTVLVKTQDSYIRVVEYTSEKSLIVGERFE